MIQVSLISIGDRTESYSLRLLKALIEAHGQKVNLIYLNIRHLFSPLVYNDKLEGQLIDLTKNSQIVGFSVFTYDYNLVTQITNTIRKKNNPLILWGGPHAIASPEECAQQSDIVVINEGEEAMIEIINGFLKSGKDFSKVDIPNIAYMENNQFVSNDIKKLPFSLDAIPFQDYSFTNCFFVDSQNKLVPFTVEDQLNQYEGGKFDYVTMYSRGCPHKCGFCLNSKKGCIPYYVGRSVDNLIDELASAKKLFDKKISNVCLYDDDFFALPLDKINEFSQKYSDRITLPIHALNSSVTSFREDKLQLLRKAGATGVIIGIQTISENGRRVYRNPASQDKIIQIVEIMKKYPDLQLIFHIIFGNPYENEDDIAENLLFLNSLPKIYYLSNYQLIIYPGTTLYEIVKKDPIHASRALEGYHTPYYYRKPELELWNYLSEKYLNQKEDLPGYVVFLLKKRQYAILKLILQPKLRNSYKIAINHYRKFGLIKTLKKGLRRILSKE